MDKRAYEQGIANRLEGVFASTVAEAPLEVGAAKIIAFSDLHRGAGDGADDFKKCERAYNAALAYYYDGGYTLIIVGDADDLWECRPAPVLERYRHTLELEGLFHKAGRYFRIWGNHDDLWASPREAARYLAPLFPGIKMREGVRLPFVDDGESIGELFFVHGHQGTSWSDRRGELSRWVVRHAWRPFQRLTRFASTTPARSWEFGKAHDLAMEAWVTTKAKDGIVLVAGHTHRPIFKSSSHAAWIQEKLDRESDPAVRQLLHAELEWVTTCGDHTPMPPVDSPPGYFNTGCCSFGDGDVTGLEIAGGNIRLVRWPDDTGAPKPKILENTDAELRGVFERITGKKPLPRHEASISPARPAAPPDTADSPREMR